MVEYSNWLKDIDDDTHISKLAIPGTHNSAACFNLAPPSVQCQGASVTDQLNNGVRFIDVRLSKDFYANNIVGTLLGSKDENDLVVVHGNFPVKLNGVEKFSSVLNEILKFVDEHKSETVILSLKQEGNGKWDNDNDEFPKVLEEKYFNNYKDKLYLDSGIPKLRDARGKIIIFRRFGVRDQNKNNQFGIPANVWSYNTTDDDRGSYRVQDFCEFKTGEDITKKCEYIKDMINKAKDYNSTQSDPKLFVNFCSGSNFYDTDCWPSHVSKTINESKINESYAKGCGIVVLDFAERENWKMSKELVDKNF
ncbi:unnamed protein product [Ambrosiozyma monospora]|uniref:Unnamed protein product n=1 Tax=Ambrosiozyma monospora TaxID=43982 RepID=A0ACB5T0W6_AMBMO|nr:unnamed protein product [Ambrosiozyma monospora]